MQGSTMPRAGILAIALLLTAALAAAPVAADKLVVVDVDGSIEDYAAITTILQHPDYNSKLRLISVSGTTWGFGPTVVRNLCRFVRLAGATVTVALGQTDSLSDAYSMQAGHGGCADVQGFPSTPRDADLRGMSYSRADVTSAYGQTYALPHIRTEAATCGYAVGAATNAFLALLRQTDSSLDTIVYLQLGSATNLAAFAAAVQEQGSSSLLAKFYAVVEVHAFETGFSGGADNTSMVQVLGSYNNNRLKVRLYPPVFYNPGVTFNFQSWATFGTIADTASTAASVTWLYRAWAKKKALLDSKNAGDSIAFFKERGPASSLVTLCALDDEIKNLCQSYRKPALTLQMVTVYAPIPSSSTESVVTVSGNNVTLPFYYVVTSKTSGETTTASSYVYDIAATSKVGSHTQILVDVFWTRWYAVLRM